MSKLGEPLDSLITELGQDIDLAIMSLELEPDTDEVSHYVVVPFHAVHLMGLDQEKQVIKVVREYCKTRGYTVQCHRADEYMNFRIMRVRDDVRLH